MNFEGDAFISYAHMDNVELLEGHKGWVTNLHRALEIRVGQLLGKPPEIWRDPKLTGNDAFGETLMERLRRVASLISVVSPRYVKSEWARKELGEFWKAAEQQGGIHFRNKARIFKVLKTPVPLESHPVELRSLLGYQFFNIDPDTGRVRELDEVFGPEAQRDFWMRLDDLAHDICCLLEMSEVSGTPAIAKADQTQKAVYLAEATFDLREQREAIKRDLQQHGYTVLPASALPQVESELKQAVRADLAQCQMSIHLIGKNFSLVPEGGMQSLLEIQNELAIERGGKGDFSRLLWIPLGLEVQDERQKKVIEQLRMDPRTQKGADLLETFLEDLRTVIQNRLKEDRLREEKLKEQRLKEAPGPAPAATPLNSSAGAITGHAQLYLIHDQRDSAVTSPWEDFLFEQGFEVIRPVFEGDEAEIREHHEENLRTCDGALIFYGSGNECWLRRKLRELQKSPGYGRSKPLPTVAICLIPPRTSDKERFRTHEALVIPQWDGFSPEPLQPLIASLKGL
jgi:predicted CoA-binding protein